MEELRLALKKTTPEIPVIVGLEGYLDSSTSFKLVDLMEGLANEGYTRIVFNMEKLEYLSSAGVSIITETLDKARLSDGDLILVGPSKKIIKVLDLCGVTKFIKIIEPTEDIDKSFERSIKMETGFPKDIKCPKCSVASKATGAGVLKCPSCSSIFIVTENGSASLVEATKYGGKMSGKMEMWIKSDISFTQPIRKFISSLAVKEGFSEDSANEIELAVDEAVTNIIEHSYNLDPEGNIGINVKTGEDRFTITLVDKGKGFDLAKKIESQNASSKGIYRGKGLSLIKSLMDEVSYTPYSDVENKLVLVKIKKESDKGGRNFINMDRKL